MTLTHESGLPDVQALLSTGVALESYTGRRKRLVVELVNLVVAEPAVYADWANALLDVSQEDGDARPMPARKLEEVVSYGFGALADDELSQLATNCFAVAQVRQAVRAADPMADHWLQAFADAADADVERTEKRANHPGDSDGKQVEMHIAARVTGGGQVRISFRTFLAKAAVIVLPLVTVAAVGAAVIAHRDADALREELVKNQQAQPIPPTPEQAFAEGMQNALRLDLQPRSGQGGVVDLLLGNFAQPPYVMGVFVDWGEGSDPEKVYLAEDKPLSPVVTHDYSSQLPVSGAIRRTVQVQYYLTGEAMQKLNLPAIVTRNYELGLSASGVRVLTPAESDGTAVALNTVTENKTFEDPFLLDFKVTRPAKVAASASTGRLHILVRPLNGPANLQEKYFVVPFQEQSAGGADQTYHVWLPLRALMNLDSVPQAKRPTQYEVTVVELPFVLTHWTVSRQQMSLDGPEFANAVKVRRVISATTRSEI